MLMAFGVEILVVTRVSCGHEGGASFMELVAL
jgi:hypothetical protein